MCSSDLYGDHRDLHVRLHSFPTRRSSELDAVLDALVDPDLHLAAAPGFVEQADDRRAADAQLLGDIFLCQALVIIEPGCPEPQRCRLRIGGMGSTSKLGHRSSGNNDAAGIVLAR